MEEVKNIIQPIEEILDRALDNIYINTGIKVFIGLYAAFAAPKLPKSIINMMDNTLVRIMVAFLIVLIATKDPSIALIVAVAFILTLQTANRYRLYNTSLSVSQAGESSWLPSVNTEINNLETRATEEETLEKKTNDMMENVPAISNNLQELIDNPQEPTDYRTRELKEIESIKLMEQEKKEALEQEKLLAEKKQEDEIRKNTDLEANEILAMSLSNPSENLKKPVVELLEMGSSSNEKSAFTSQYQFVDAQSNNVPGTNITSSPGTFSNQFCIQGSQDSKPNGYNF